MSNMITIYYMRIVICIPVIKRIISLSWCKICSSIPFSISHNFLLIFNDLRSDAQRAAKQKEAKERELEQCSFSAERIEEGGFPLSMVRWGKKRDLSTAMKV